MEKYISILRGINVSGQKKMLMADVKKAYESIGFEDVVTYIQSGNIVFTTTEKSTDLAVAQKIEKMIMEQFSFDVPVIVFKGDELKEWIDNNPFFDNENLEERLYFTFLDKIPESSLVDSIQEIDYSPEKFKVLGKVVYFYCPIGYGNTKLSNNFFEKKLKVRATTRNLKTTLKLLEMSGF